MTVPFAAALFGGLDTELQSLGIGRIDRRWLNVKLTDSGITLQPGVPPYSVGKYQSDGLNYLRTTARPDVVLLRSLHHDGLDFRRLLNAFPTVLALPFLFVEAGPDTNRPLRDGIPEPLPSPTNEMLRKFNVATFAHCDAYGIRAIPCEAQFGDNPLGARLRELDEHYEALKRNTQMDRDLRACLLTVLHFYLEIYRAWGIVDQMGLWAKDPAVQALIGDSTGRWPLLLGFAHGTEYSILHHYLGLDVSMAQLQRHLPPGTSKVDDRLFWQRYTAQQHNLEIPLQDLLEAPFPY